MFCEVNKAGFLHTCVNFLSGTDVKTKDIPIQLGKILDCLHF